MRVTISTIRFYSMAICLFVSCCTALIIWEIKGIQKPCIDLGAYNELLQGLGGVEP